MNVAVASAGMGGPKNSVRSYPSQSLTMSESGGSCSSSQPGVHLLLIVTFDAPLAAAISATALRAHQSVSNGQPDRVIPEAGADVDDLAETLAAALLHPAMQFQLVSTEQIRAHMLLLGGRREHHPCERTAHDLVPDFRYEFLVEIEQSLLFEPRCGVRSGAR